MLTAVKEPTNDASATVETKGEDRENPKTITSIAPNEPPAETPKVKGVAKGFLNKACKTTPDVASAAPTRAPAITRGVRAINNIWASIFSEKGISKLNAEFKLIDVEPTKGASTQIANAAK